ncbi:MAG: hypothetical protein NW206_19970 [Hyphomonadaceae bacterium]|nr:hypothetical protein [Hyphomonadaceae bacterium]
MTDDLLQGLMEHELEAACAQIKAGGEYPARFIAMNDEREVFYIVTPWGGERDKLATLEFLRLFFIRHQVKRYVQVAEAWIVERGPDYKPGSEPPPGECADRIETVFACGVDYSGVRMASVRINRDGDQVTFTEPDWAGSGKLSGRMTELLPRGSERLSLWDQAKIDSIFAEMGGEQKRWMH